MNLKISKIIIFLLLLFLISCQEVQNQHSITLIQENFEFPETIDVRNIYMVYLHGKIIEDQGLPAISPQYGEYEYEAILQTLSEKGFYVISEIRTGDTDSTEYASIVVNQINELIAAGVPAQNITIVGASKGAAVGVLISHFLENEDVNFVLMAICHPDIVNGFIQDEVSLKGNILSIYDQADEMAGSCRKLFSYSEGKGISRYDEIVLDIGTGHGVLYQPLEEWINPTVEWAKEQSK